jgi:hypothetical protein
MRQTLGRSAFWICVTLATLVLVLGGVNAINHNRLDQLLGPIWFAAILYVIGLAILKFARMNRAQEPTLPNRR